MNRPKHNIPASEKDVDYVKSVYDYYNSRTANVLISLDEADRKRAMAYGKYINMEDYSYVLNPLNKQEYKNRYPARMRNNSIISPIFRQLLGEKFARIFEPQVVALNSDITNRQQKARVEATVNALNQAFVNQLVRQGLYVPGETDENGNPVNPPEDEEAITRRAMSERDIRSIMGQNALDYIYMRQEHDRKTRMLFSDLLALGVVASYKHGLNGEVEYIYVNPANLQVYGNPQSGFFEDAEAVRHTTYMTLSEAIDMFNGFEEFDEDVIADLEGRGGSTRFGGIGGRGGIIGQHLNNTNYFIDSEAVEVVHLQWKSLVKIGRVQGVNESGNLEYVYVDETYLPLEGEAIEWLTVNEAWETFVIAGEYFVGWGPVENQRGSFTNPSLCKLSYNGYRSVLPPLPDELEADQIALNIVEYNIEKSINKNKDSIVVLPLSLVPKKAGWDEFKTMYYADAHGILYVDDSDKAALQSLQYIKSIDWKMSQHLQMLMQRAAEIKVQAQERIGFNRFRTSSINSSDAVGNVQQGQYAGSLITETLFQEFEEFEQREAEGLLDISKTTFRNGKRAMYIRRDGDDAMLEIDDDYAECEYNIFVRSGGKSKEILDIIKSQSTNLLQQGLDPVALFKSFNSGGNVQKLIQVAEDSRRRTEQIAREKEEADRQSNERIAKIHRQTELDKMNLDYYKIDTESATKLEIADLGSDKDGEPDRGKNLTEFTNTMMLLQDKREDRASREKVARMNNASREKISDDQLRAQALLARVKTKKA